MSEEKKNGSVALPAAGTVSSLKSPIPNVNIQLPLFQGDSYKKLEYEVTEGMVGRLQVNGQLDSLSLSDLGDIVLTEMVGQVKLINILDKRKWTVPKVLSPVQGALIVQARETIRLVCTEDDLASPVASGVLALYQREGEYAGTYRELSMDVVTQMAFELAGAVETKWRLEFYKTLQDTAERVCECTNSKYVFLKNGIFDYETRDLMPFSSEIVTLQKSPVELPDMEPPVPVHIKPDGTRIDFWEWIDSLVPYDGGRDLLIKLIGAVMRNRHVWRVMITLYNPNGKNGKSTYLRLLKACVGKGSVMSSNLERLCDSQFGLANLPGTMLITCEDSDSGTYIRSTSSVKCIISHDPVSVERKGLDSFNYTPHCMIISASNDLPKTKDKTPAWQGRNLYVPFTGEFAGVADPTISSEWVVSKEFCQYALYQALVKWDAYTELPEPNMAMDLKREVMTENDSVLEFLEVIEDRGNLDFIPNGYAWFEYKRWMTEHRPTTSLQAERTFLKHLAEVGVQSGRWLQPKGADGKGVRLNVATWTTCKLPDGGYQVHDVNVGTYSDEYSRGIVRKEVWEYCQSHNIKPKDMLLSDYDDMRRKYGIIRSGVNPVSKNSSKRVIPYIQA